MAISDINKTLRKYDGEDGFSSLALCLKDLPQLKGLTKRDLLYLVNKQLEGVTESTGNIFMYMIYFSCTDPAGKANTPTWYNIVKPNPSADLRNDATHWCACYVSFALNFAGINSNGHYTAYYESMGKYCGLDPIYTFDGGKSFDTLHLAEGHVAFLLKEDKDKPNSYDTNQYFIGGNQGQGQGNFDSVNIGGWGKPVGTKIGNYTTTLGRHPNHDTHVNVGDCLSVLEYFIEPHKRSSDERMAAINARINKDYDSSNVKVSSKAENIIGLRTQNGEKAGDIGKYGLYINDGMLRERFRELLIFEEGLKASALQVASGSGGSTVRKPPNAIGADEKCGKASFNDVNNIYPKTKLFYGSAEPILKISDQPTISIKKSDYPTVEFKQTIVTEKDFVIAVEEIIDILIRNATKDQKFNVLLSAFVKSKQEQGTNGGFRGFNNNISGVESDGFKVFNKDDVDGQVFATEGGTNIRKPYYSFKNLGAGLIPSITTIINRNLFGDANEWAWRYYRDWNGFGGRTLTTYVSECTSIKKLESLYNTYKPTVMNLTKYK